VAVNSLHTIPCYHQSKSLQPQLLYYPLPHEGCKCLFAPNKTQKGKEKLSSFRRVVTRDHIFVSNSSFENAIPFLTPTDLYKRQHHHPNDQKRCCVNEPRRGCYVAGGRGCGWHPFCGRRFLGSRRRGWVSKEMKNVLIISQV